MAPVTDDNAITDNHFLLRVLLSKWSIVKNGRERPTSDSLLDSNHENSCFVEGEITVEAVQEMFPGLKLARLPVRVVRLHGFAIERRPPEAPVGCAIPAAHVVIGPMQLPTRGDYEKQARNIVKSLEVEIIYPPEIEAAR